ncbi:MAG: DUF3891 family protein [Acidobacteriota bacterium]
MILHPRPPGLAAISQSAHALLAFQLADHWGNRETPRPAPRAEVLAAVLLHDAGWDDAEDPPRLAPDGRPLAFDTFPGEEREALWTASIRTARARSRYAAYLVSHHVSLLASDYARQPHPGVLAREQARRERLRAELEREPAYSQLLETGADAVNRAVLRLCDGLAVHLARGADGRSELPGLHRRDGEVPIELRAVGERVYRLDPWPLIGRRLTVSAEARLLPSDRFPDETTLRAAWNAAPTVRLAWRLLAPGTRAD